ncbi:hypothetical protein NC653_026269 [Populus alba x Populus x berolinensis]|uniref:Uncharacterized protein n=1 Tax=Populus alba x Populus x berolinensis TaxID=444605 RepID=A0AAD6MDF5_9ROSI|nr:hypothetical protein NC653_026269 [Populus alba x Populus x berolinensis]
MIFHNPYLFLGNTKLDDSQRVSCFIFIIVPFPHSFEADPSPTLMILPTWFMVLKRLKSTSASTELLAISLRINFESLSLSQNSNFSIQNCANSHS